MFDHEFRTFGTVLGDATLSPEAGLHHNWSAQYGLREGYLEIHFFHDRVGDTIFTQFQFVDGAPVFSFLPVDRVRTRGLELIFTQKSVLGTNLELQANAAFIDSRIIEHQLNPALTGNRFPRIPKASLRLFGLYRWSNGWDFGLGASYSGNQFGELDNRDTVRNVFGAIDEHFSMSLKTSYRFDFGGRVSLGVDNLTNEKAYVFHPWPQRTYFVEFSWEGIEALFR